MKKTKLFLMLFLAAASVCGFTACSDDDDDSASAIVGTWEYREFEYVELVDTYIFSADGSYTNVVKEGNYTDSDRGTYTFKKSTLTLKSAGYDEVDTYKATISGNKLTLIDEDGDEYIYTRK